MPKLSNYCWALECIFHPLEKRKNFVSIWERLLGLCRVIQRRIYLADKSWINTLCASSKRFQSSHRGTCLTLSSMLSKVFRVERGNDCQERVHKFVIFTSFCSSRKTTTLRCRRDNALNGKLHTKPSKSLCWLVLIWKWDKKQFENHWRRSQIWNLCNLLA